MKNVDEIIAELKSSRRNYSVGAWIEHLDSDLHRDKCNDVRVIVESDNDNDDYPIFKKEIKNNQVVLSKEIIANTIFKLYKKYKFDRDNGKLIVDISNNNINYRYTFLRNTTARTYEIWDDLATKGNLLLSDKDYTLIFSEQDIQEQYEHARKYNPNPFDANELSELLRNMRNHDYDKIPQLVYADVYDGQVWVMVDHNL